MNRFLTLLATVAVTTNLAHSFGGPLVGVELGGGYLNGNHIYSANGLSGKKSVTKLGIFYGSFAAYLHEIGTSKTFVGGGLHINLSSAKGEADYGVNGGTVLGKVNVKRGLGIAPTAIVGKLMNPKVMVYASMAYEHVKYEVTYNGTQPTSLNQKVNQAFGAITPGAGIMYKVNDNVIVGGEYRYSLFKKKNIIAANGVTTQLDPAEHRMMARVAYRFNMG